MKRLNDHRLIIGGEELVPIMVGGMGCDISTSKMALEVARLGGIGHISDALSGAVTDRHYKTNFIKTRFAKYKQYSDNNNKAMEQFDLGAVLEATKILASKTMEAKKGKGSIFINIMEKLTMNNPKETLSARLTGALDAGIDGISLSAGLHLSSFSLMADHKRFRDAKLGIIVSSLRALKLFLKKTVKLRRLPDFVVVEGPLAGGHLGFHVDNWFKYDLKEITKEIIGFVRKEKLPIPIIPAGGIFTGADATEMIQLGAQAIQVANRFTVTEESGIPFEAKQEYFKAEKKNIVVNNLSPTGYPMRMLDNSPCINAGIQPNCESIGYLLDGNGDCSYISAYYEERAKNPTGPISVKDKTCLCTHMKNYKTWTCGHTTDRLKETTNKLPNNLYQLLTVEDVMNDYLFSPNHEFILPKPVASETPQSDQSRGDSKADRVNQSATKILNNIGFSS
ncbi:MAG: nitronate monooxygenase [Deltaproteobacteria bacterium]|nr:nitronate monooxygenase [Deltaproteobacteria bacterium]